MGDNLENSHYILHAVHFIACQQAVTISINQITILWNDDKFCLMEFLHFRMTGKIFEQLSFRKIRKFCGFENFKKCEFSSIKN